jgi:hypothetical protein
MSTKKPPPKKTRNQPYMNFEVAQALFDQNQSAGVRKSTFLAAGSSTREGCRFLRCYAVAGSGAMRFAAAWPSCCRTWPSPWTLSGGTCRHTSRA